MNTKRTARQVTATLAIMDAQIARLEAIVNDFHSIAALADGPVSDEIGTAFNAATDALDALQRDRIVVAENRPARPQTILSSLVAQNID